MQVQVWSRFMYEECMTASFAGVLVREVLIQAMVCYTEVLTSDKLQLSGNTWRLVARCALSEEGQVGIG